MLKFHKQLLENIKQDVGRVDLDLIKTLNSLVKPIYLKSDISHGWDYHIMQVLHFAIEIADKYCLKHNINLNYNIIYAMVILHDITRYKDPKNHEKTSADYVRHIKKYLRKWFNDSEIDIIANAVQEHRASNGNPSDIYGKILSDADRMSDLNPEVMLTRCFYFRLNTRLDLNTYDKMFDDIFEFLLTKYGKNGYAKLILNESNNIAKNWLLYIKHLLLNKNEFKKIFDKLVDNGIIKF